MRRHCTRPGRACQTNAKVEEGLAPTAVAEKRGQEFAEEATNFFRGQLEIAVPMWNSPVQGFGVDQLRRALERASRKVDKPREALTAAQRACQAELEKVV